MLACLCFKCQWVASEPILQLCGNIEYGPIILYYFEPQQPSTPSTPTNALIRLTCQLEDPLKVKSMEVGNTKEMILPLALQSVTSDGFNGLNSSLIFWYTQSSLTIMTLAPLSMQAS